MSKARDMINAHLYPVLAVFSVIYLAIQIEPAARWFRYQNRCIEMVAEVIATDEGRIDYKGGAGPEAICNGIPSP